MAANLKGLFNSLTSATGKYDDLARKIIGNADDAARATGNIIELDDLMQIGKRPANPPIEPITIGNYIKPDHSPLSLGDVRKMDAGQSVQDILDSGSFRQTLENAAKNATNNISFDDLVAQYAPKNRGIRGRLSNLFNKLR